MLERIWQCLPLRWQCLQGRVDGGGAAFPSRGGGSDHGWSREVAGGADLRVSTETLDSDAGVKTGSYVCISHIVGENRPSAWGGGGAC